MSASPGRRAVTNPVPLTVATTLFEDAHDALLVTSCVEPFERVAVAENCAVLPTDGAVPVTETDDTDAVGDVGDEFVGDDPPQPHRIVVMTNTETNDVAR